MNENEAVVVDLSWPGGMVELTFLTGAVFGFRDEHPVRIEAVAGRFHGTAEGDVLDLAGFLVDLERLYVSLRGEVRLMSYDERNAVLTLTGVGNGRIDVDVTVASDPFGQPDQVLRVRGQIDQSYLPPIIASVREAVMAAGKPSVVSSTARRTLVPRGILQWSAATVLTLSPLVILIAEVFRPEPNTVFLVRGVGAMLLIAMLLVMGERELRAGR